MRKAYWFRVALVVVGIVAGVMGWNGVDAGISFDRPRTLTLALKFVEFSRADGKPVLTQSQANRIVDRLNSLFAQCSLKLRLERYEQVEPAELGLNHPITSPSQMDTIRKPFHSAEYLVVIHTAPWHHGPMGPANAWTAMPGQMPAGAVLEAPVAGNSNITAHELGHYLGLDHSRDEVELMNPVIYSRSTYITPEQCRLMRETALVSRAKALRDA